MYMKSFLSGVISLVRSNRPTGLPTPTYSTRKLLALAEKHTGAADDPAPNVEPDEGLCVADVGAALEISPQTLVLPFVGAVERHLDSYRWVPRADSDSESDDETALGRAPRARGLISLKRDPSVAIIEPARNKVDTKTEGSANGLTRLPSTNGLKAGATSLKSATNKAPSRTSSLLNGARDLSPVKAGDKAKPKREPPATLAPVNGALSSPSLRAELFPEVNESSPNRRRRHSVISSSDGADSDDRVAKGGKKGKPAKRKTAATGKAGKKDSKSGFADIWT